MGTLTEPSLPPADAELVLDQRRFCTRCGYSLYSLRIAGLCPECGLPVANSLHDRDELVAMTNVRRGCTWLLMQTVASATASLASFFLFTLRDPNTVPGFLLWIRVFTFTHLIIVAFLLMGVLRITMGRMLVPGGALALAVAARLATSALFAVYVALLLDDLLFSFLWNRWIAYPMLVSWLLTSILVATFAKRLLARDEPRIVGPLHVFIALSVVMTMAWLCQQAGLNRWVGPGGGTMYAAAMQCLGLLSNAALFYAFWLCRKTAVRILVNLRQPHPPPPLR